MSWQDLRVAIHSLFHAPGFAAVGILTMAIAIGMATSVFTVVNALLLRPLPYQNADRLAMIWDVSGNESRGPVSFDDFEDWRRDSKTPDKAALYTTYYKPVLTGVGQPQRTLPCSSLTNISRCWALNPCWDDSSAPKKTAAAMTM